MELREAIQQRRSTAAISDVAPTDEQLQRYLQLAAHAPDHAALRPWRLVTLRGTQRDRLGAALAAGFGDAPGSTAEQRTRAKPLRAPLLIGIIATPSPHPKVPEWEQLAAAVAMVTSLQLLMFEDNWVTFWRTGPATDLAQVRDVMGATEHEQLLGWLYTGRSASDGPLADPATVAPIEVEGKIRSLPDPS